MSTHTNDATDRESLDLKGGFSLIRAYHRSDTATHDTTRNNVAIAISWGPRSRIWLSWLTCKILEQEVGLLGYSRIPHSVG